MYWLLHAFHFSLVRNGGAAIVDAISNYRPSVILALFNNIDFVATLWPVFVIPDFTGHRVFYQTLGISMSIAIYGCFCPFGIYKRIV